MQQICFPKSLVLILKSSFFMLLFWGMMASAQAAEDLRTDESIVIKNGRVLTNAIVGDESAEIFIEMVKDFYVADTASETRFEGEILPPMIIEAQAKPPRARMREILSFELFTDNNLEVRFVDKYSLMSEQSRLRESILDPNLTRTGGAQFLTQLYDEEEIGNAALWQYFPFDDSWRHVGGLTSNTSEPGIQIFSAKIYGTGIYTLWDENPAPTFSPTFPLDEIELVDLSPFPSVEVGLTPSALDPEILDDFDTLDTFDEDLVIPALEEAGLALLEEETPPLEVEEFEPETSPPAEDPNKPLVLFGNTIQTEGLALNNLIPNTSPAPPETTTPIEIQTPSVPDTFSDTFLESLPAAKITPPELVLKSAPLEITPPPSALLPQSGQTPINPLPLILLVTFFIILGGSFYLASKKPY